MIDFGLSIFYIEEQLHQINETSILVGSPKYASIFLHKGYKSSRRDDIISLCYMAIKLESGHWCDNIEDITEIMKIKERAYQYTDNEVLKQFLYDNINNGLNYEYYVK